MELDEIHLSLGIGDLRFGMSKSDVINLLGRDYREKADKDGDLELEFGQFSIRCTFWSDCDFRLGVLSTERETVILNNERLYGKTREELTQFIKEKLQSDLSEEDDCIHEDGHVQSWIGVDENNVSFWFRNDSLYLVDCFCAWTDNGTPKWPMG